MLNNKNLIETYVSNAKTRISNLPRPNGNLNKLDKLLKNTEQLSLVEKIANEEIDKLLKHVNSELVPSWSEDQREEFLKEAKGQFADLVRTGIKEVMFKS